MEPQTITLTVKATLCRDQNGGVMHMIMSDCSATVEQNGEPMGHVSACIGGGIELSDTTRQAWFISYPDLWEAYRAALQASE